MRNKRGEIATLLTLGLVLVGGLVTLGLSVLSNRQSINTNSRAAINCNGPYTCSGNGKKYWFRPGASTNHNNSECSGEDLDLSVYCAASGPTKTPTPNPGTPTPTPKPGTPTPTPVGSGGTCEYLNLSECLDDNSGCPSNNCQHCSGSTRYKCVAGGGGGGGTPAITPTPTLTPVPGSGCTQSFDKACCFEKNGTVSIYATAAARNLNAMCTPCDKAHYGSAYGATDWFECNEQCGGKSRAECNALSNPITSPPPSQKCSNQPGGVCVIKGSSQTVTQACTAINKSYAGYYDCDDVNPSGICCKNASTNITLTPAISPLPNCGRFTVKCNNSSNEAKYSAQCKVNAAGDGYECTMYESLLCDASAKVGTVSLLAEDWLTWEKKINAFLANYILSAQAQDYAIKQCGSSQSGTGSSGSGNQPTGQCYADQGTLRVGLKTYTVANANELNTLVACNKRLIIDDTDLNVKVFRECPNLVQGNSCVYTCYQNNQNVNCRDVGDSWAGSSLTIFNRSNTNILVTARLPNIDAQLFSSQNVTANSFIQADLPNCNPGSTTKLSITISRDGGKNWEVYGGLNSMKCGSKVVIEIN